MLLCTIVQIVRGLFSVPSSELSAIDDVFIPVTS